MAILKIYCRIILANQSIYCATIIPSAVSNLGVTFKNENIYFSKNKYMDSIMSPSLTA